MSKVTYSNSHIHSHIPWCSGCHARCWPAHQEQVRGSVSCLTRPGESNQQPSDNKTLTLRLSHSCPPKGNRHQQWQAQTFYQTAPLNHFGIDLLFSSFEMKQEDVMMSQLYAGFDLLFGTHANVARLRKKG